MLLIDSESQIMTNQNNRMHMPMTWKINLGESSSHMAGVMYMWVFLMASFKRQWGKIYPTRWWELRSPINGKEPLSWGSPNHFDTNGASNFKWFVLVRILCFRFKDNLESGDCVHISLYCHHHTVTEEVVAKKITISNKNFIKKTLAPSLLLLWTWFPCKKYTVAVHAAFGGQLWESLKVQILLT